MRRGFVQQQDAGVAEQGTGDREALPLATAEPRPALAESWRFSDDGFYDIGAASDDIGRGKLTPKIALSRFAFKTPTLRNVAQRAPYLHDGSVATLEAVIDLYDRGGLVRRPSLSREIRPLGLSAAEKHDLIAFLQTLTSQDAEARVPSLPR